MSAYVSIRQHTSAYVSVRQRASAYLSRRREGPTVTDTLPPPRYHALSPRLKPRSRGLVCPTDYTALKGFKFSLKDFFGGFKGFKSPRLKPRSRGLVCPTDYTALKG
jgi:hypothetical protein